MKRELLLGCGSRREKLLSFGPKEWGNLITLDSNPCHNPDVVWDLNRWPLPFEDNAFDELHAYEVLEHIGKQGRARLFFAEFAEYWRILKPDGLFVATVPWWQSEWAWGDPSHRRVITPGTLVFLSQREYREQVGKTPMSDFRHIWKGDFETVSAQRDGESFCFCLKAIK